MLYIVEIECWNIPSGNFIITPLYPIRFSCLIEDVVQIQSKKTSDLSDEPVLKYDMDL
jgi:hypothetical protein